MKMMKMMKWPGHICCLGYQWSKILRSAVKCMSSSVFIPELRNCDRNGSNYYTPYFCSLGLVNLWILGNTHFYFCWYMLLCCIFICYIVTHLAIECRQIGQILQAVTVDVSSLFLCVTVNIWSEKKMLISFP